MYENSLQGLTYDLGDCQNYGPFLGSYYNAGSNTGLNLRDPPKP